MPTLSDELLNKFWQIEKQTEDILTQIKSY